MDRTDVQATLRDMWETRPPRPRQDRQIAGVAAGIAHRYDIDPVLVRIGFVVAALSGIGAALYIAGWIVLPEERSGPQARSPKVSMLVGLGVAAVATLGWFFDGAGALVLPLLAAAVLLYLLHRSRGNRGTAPVRPTAEPPTVASESAATAPVSMVKHPVPPPHEPELPRTPPAWDPLGAAPFAWDLPEPAAPPPPPPPKRLPVTAVTLGLALLAGGITAVIQLVSGTLNLAGVPILFGVVLAVMGAGLVVGAFLRAGRGLIPLALLLCALTWAVVAAPLDRWQGKGFGDLRVAPTEVAQMQPSYALTVGDVELDLRRLNLAATGANQSPVPVRVSLAAGDVQILVPRDADLAFTGQVGVGEINFNGQENSGPDVSMNVANDLGADGVESGRRLVIDVENGAGSVEVRRG